MRELWHRMLASHLFLSWKSVGNKKTEHRAETKKSMTNTVVVVTHVFLCDDVPLDFKSWSDSRIEIPELDDLVPACNIPQRNTTCCVERISAYALTCVAHRCFVNVVSVVSKCTLITLGVPRSFCNSFALKAKLTLWIRLESATSLLQKRWCPASTSFSQPSSVILVSLSASVLGVDLG